MCSPAGTKITLPHSSGAEAGSLCPPQEFSPDEMGRFHKWFQIKNQESCPFWGHEHLIGMLDTGRAADPIVYWIWPEPCWLLTPSGWVIIKEEAMQTTDLEIVVHLARAEMHSTEANMLELFKCSLQMLQCFVFYLKCWGVCVSLNSSWGINPFSWTPSTYFTSREGVRMVNRHRKHTWTLENKICILSSTCS